MLGPFYKIQLAKDARRDGDALWAKALKKGGNAYFTAPLDVFIKQYLLIKERLFLEVIPPEQDIKVYMDVEFYPKEDPTFNMDTCVRCIIDEVRVLLNIPELEPYQLDASNERKSSRHLFFPVVMPNKDQVEQFVTKVHANLLDRKAYVTKSGAACGIDLSVYSRERLFRIAYSWKYGEPDRPLLPLIKDEDRERVIRASLISHHLDGLPRITWTDVQTTKRIRHANIDGVDYDENWQRLLDYLIDYQPVSVVLKSPMSLSCSLRMVCARRQREHKSNHIFCNVTIHPNMRVDGWFVCSDKDCGGARWHMPYNLNAIMFPNETLHEFNKFD